MNGHLQLALGIGHNLHIYHSSADTGRCSRKDLFHNIFDLMMDMKILGSKHIDHHSAISADQDKLLVRICLLIPCSKQDMAYKHPIQVV